MSNPFEIAIGNIVHTSFDYHLFQTESIKYIIHIYFITYIIIVPSIHLNLITFTWGPWDNLIYVHKLYDVLMKFTFIGIRYLYA